jgi:hypothetical protein
MAPRRDSSARTRPTSGIILQAGDPSKIEEDKNEIRDYVKEVLFEKVVFIWKSWSKEGKAFMVKMTKAIKEDVELGAH